MAHSFVATNAFQPNNGDWTAIGNIQAHHVKGNVIQLDMAATGRAVQVSFLGPRCFRVRYAPVTSPDYTTELSHAIVNRSLGTFALKVVDNGTHLVADTGSIEVRIDLNPYRIQVFRSGQLVSADEPKYNLVYIPGAAVTANFKTLAPNARCCGFGEKGGASLFKNGSTMTFFNFDNFGLGQLGRFPTGDPRDPALPLYCSIPLLIEVNPNPVGDFAGAPYCYGLFFDNPGQTYFNINYDDYGHSMAGRYYFGALYNEMDYYFMGGDVVRDVLAQYTTLTGRSDMPPRYVFGYHQGAYGYYDRYKLSDAANGHRMNRIPIDGLAVDIDIQNNYRVFTTSEKKFPTAPAYFAGLRSNGFKCCTNITAIVKRSDTDDVHDLDENGNPSPYPERDALLAANALIPNQLQGDPAPTAPYMGSCTYGNVNPPYPSPPHVITNGFYEAVISGWYPDICTRGARKAWGEQYRYLIQQVQLDFIWQDMMCPAVNQKAEPEKSLPLDLMQDRGDGQRVPHAMIHNVFGLNMLRATWEGVAKLRKDVGINRRNFIIARGGYAGMQRYAGLWTGDSPSSRRYLVTLIPQTLNLGLSGVPISGSDVGGFAPGEDSVPPNDWPRITHYVVFVRWVQISAFLSWFRNHYGAYSKGFQEVYKYGEPVPTYCRQVIELRYRLIPLFYSAMYEWTRTGTPICRPLFLNDPQDLVAYDHCDDQFFVGDDLLVAPIVPALDASGLNEFASRQVYLPAGSSWYAFQDNRGKLDIPVPGGTLLSGPTAWRARLDQIPIYVRDGTIIPMRDRVEQFVGDLAQNPLVLNVYPGTDRTRIVYLDDGITLDAAEAQVFRLLVVSQTTAAGGRQVRVRRDVDKWTPPEPFFYVAFLGTPRPTAVKVNGTTLPDAGSKAVLDASPVNAYAWDAGTEIAYVKVGDQNPNTVVELS